MTAPLRIEVDRWLDAEHGADATKQTSALLRIVLGNHLLTRAASDWSKSVDESVHLSAYPLALWLASSWWRLRWEPAPANMQGRPTSWRMSHELRAAGEGFLWPHVVFESGGHQVEVRSFPTCEDSPEPTKYLTQCRQQVLARDFEQAVDAFLELTLARLSSVGHTDSELHLLWAEVTRERSQEASYIWRKFEAQLGFEPDDAPAKLISDLLALKDTAGPDVIDEIVLACRGAEPSAMLARILQLGESGGAEARVGSIDPALAQRTLEKQWPPWEQGKAAARWVRQAWSLGSESISDNALSGLLHLDEQAFSATARSAARPPLGLAIRTAPESDELRLLFRSRNRPGRRFEAARFMADHLLSPKRDRWLVTSDERTDRQKRQRAFAAELLCPIETLKAELDGDYEPEALDEAAERFGISAFVVQRQLQDHGLLERSGAG